MKKLFCFALIVLLSLSSLSVAALDDNTCAVEGTSSIITLRAGGGGGSGGGGGGGGSSGGSHSHSGSGSGRRSSWLETIIDYIMMPFIFFSSSIIFTIQLTKRSRKAKKLMKQMAKSDNAWKFNDLESTVHDGFYAIQTAWSELDMTSAKKYMSDELFDSFQTKLNWMDYKNQRNILENIKLLKALPVAVHDDPDNSRDFVWFYIKAKMVDYTIDTNTQAKIDGTTSASSFVEYWQFVRKENDWVLNKILQKNETAEIPFCE